jgi:hypothetical protein
MFQGMRLIAHANLRQSAKGRYGVPIQWYFPEWRRERLGLRQGKATQAHTMGRAEQDDSRVLVPERREARIGAGRDRSGVNVSGMWGDQRFGAWRVRSPGCCEQRRNLGSQVCRRAGIKCAGNGRGADRIRGGVGHRCLSWTSRKRCNDYSPAGLRRLRVPSGPPEICLENLLTLRLARVYY